MCGCIHPPKSMVMEPMRATKALPLGPGGPQVGATSKRAIVVLAGVAEAPHPHFFCIVVLAGVAAAPHPHVCLGASRCGASFLPCLPGCVPLWRTLPIICLSASLCGAPFPLFAWLRPAVAHPSFFSHSLGVPRSGTLSLRYRSAVFPYQTSAALWT